MQNALFAGALHHAHLQETSDPDLIKHLDQANRLYVAAFRDGSIKVGTSTEHRSQTRLLEQGAWMARFVASTTNGITVRVVEDLITERLGLPQSIAITRKLNGLTQPRRDEWLESELANAAADVHKVMKSEGEVAGITAIDKVIDKVWVNPALAEPGWNRVHLYPHKLNAGTHEMHVIGACGGVVAFRRNAATDGDVFVADLRQLFGFGLAESKNEELAPVTVQDQLF